MSDSDAPAQRLDELIAHFDHAMLVTRARDGGLHARPLAIAERHEHGGLYFSTDRQSEKVAEIEAHAEVAVTMQSGHRFLAISGHAELVSDSRLIERLYSAGWKLWFPDGPSDPNLVLLRIDPLRAEYWDRSTQRNRLRFWMEAGKAVVQDRAVDSDKLTGHGELDLR